jgi:hypothetical protein
VQIWLGDPRHRDPRRTLPPDQSRDMNPAAIDFNTWRGREHEGIAVTPRAGEILFRLKPASAATAPQKARRGTVHRTTGMIETTRRLVDTM